MKKRRAPGKALKSPACDVNDVNAVLSCFEAQAARGPVDTYGLSRTISYMKMRGLNGKALFSLERLLCGGRGR
jgi:hypothetical protein